MEDHAQLRRWKAAWQKHLHVEGATAVLLVATLCLPSRPENRILELRVFNFLPANCRRHPYFDIASMMVVVKDQASSSAKGKANRSEMKAELGCPWKLE
jgi:hypothetical protein